MSSRKLTVVLDLDTGGYSGRLRTAASEMRMFNGTVSRTSPAVRQLGNSFDSMGRSMSTPLQKLREFVLITASIRFALINVRDIAVGWVGVLIKQSAEVERLTILMKGLSNATTEAGRNAEARQNFEKLIDLSRNSGFAVQELADSFVKMKSAGLDPMNGSMQSLVDAVAAFGGTSDIMHRASIAIQQMAGKGVISMEELRQQLGEAVPSAIQSMARAMGKTVPELTKEISKGTVQAGPALQALFEEWNRQYAGAAARMAQTFNGQISQLRTNMMVLSTEFTGLFDTVNQNGQSQNLFGDTKNSLQELNAALQTQEAKQFMRDLGMAVNTVGQAFVGLIKIIIEWRSQIGAAIAVFAAGFAFKTVVSAGSGVVEMLRGVRQGLVDAASSAQAKGTALSDLANRYRTLNSEIAARATRLQAEAQAARTNLDLANRQVTSSQQQVAAINQKRQALIAEQQAMVAKIAAARQEEMLARAAIANGGATQANIQRVTAAKSAQTDATIRLAGAKRGLAAADAQLAAASRTAALAQVSVDRATAASTRATVVAEAAQKRLAASTTIAAGAARAASLALAGLRTAFAILTGPIGIFISMIGAAAIQAGVFESRANSAAAAAARLAAGIATVADAQDAQNKIKALDEELPELRRKARGNRTIWESMQNDELLKDLSGQSAREAPAIREELRQKQALRDKLQKRLNNFQNTVLPGQQAQDIVSGLATRFQAEQAKRSGQYNAKVTELDQQMQAGIISKEERNRRVAVLRSQGLDIKQFTDAYVASLRQQRAEADNAGKSTLMYDIAISELTRSGDQAAPSVSGVGAAAADAGEKASKGSKGLSDFEKAMKKIDTALDSQREKLAGLQAELDGKQTEFAKATQAIANGEFKGASKEALAEYLSNAQKIDEVNKRIDANKVFMSLEDELKQAATEAESLWTSYNRGTMEADVRTAQIKSRFADLIASLSGEDAVKAKQTVQDIIDKVNAADAANIAQEWDLATEQINISLLNEQQARQRAFEVEMERQRRLIDLTREGTAERARMEAAFARFSAAKTAELARAQEGATVRMARSWSEMAINLDNALAQSIANMSESMAAGEFNIAKLAGQIIKQLLKVILQAMIAYAILSMIPGMAPTAPGGGKLSLGGFIKQGFSQFGQGFGGNTGSNSSNIVSTGEKLNMGPVFRVDGKSSILNPPKMPVANVGVNHSGGVIGDARTMRTVAASLFDSAQRYHTGAKNGPVGLMPGEVPIIAEEGEIILNAAQQKSVAGAMKPNVSINFINNSGTALTAQEEEPRFDGKNFIIDVVVDAMSKPGRMRNAMKAAQK